MADDPTLLPSDAHPLDNGTLDMFGGDSTGEVARGYVVLARKYRPATFEDLIGQDAMVTTLRHAFAADRIAQGYMLTGVRGVGKTTTARILARALEYWRPGLPDRPATDLSELGVHCRDIIDSRHPDVIEMDAASNTGIENMREIIESARYKPITARYKVFIIDEVHMLSKSAFNALLKTLEEPPPHVKFIFATTEIRKVPVTILSRCQRFDLRRVDVPTLAAHFERIVAKEGAKAEDEALAVIARSAGGSVRDGLSVLDQAIATAAGANGTGAAMITATAVRAMLGLADRGRLFDLLDHLFAGRAGGALDAFAALHADGADPIQVLEDLAEAVHIATRVKVAGEKGGGDALSAEERQRAGALQQALSVPVLSRAWSMLLKGIDEASRAPDAGAAAEMVLIRIAHAADLPSPEELIRTLGGGTMTRRVQPALLAPAAAPIGAQETRAALVQPAPISSEPPPPSSLDDYGAVDLEADTGDAQASDDDRDEIDGTESPQMRAAPQMPDPRTFLEVVALVAQRRDARLRVHLEEDVGLVKFDPAGMIEFNLLANAPAELANDLREKLNKWTGRRWMVAVSRAPGEPPLGDQERARQAVELEALKVHPAVAALLAAFPEGRIESVTAVTPRIDEVDDDQATG